MLRASVLSLLLLTLVASDLPVSGSLAYKGERSASSRSKDRHFRQRRSRAWWRRRRAWLRRRRARALERRQYQFSAASDPARTNSSPNLLRASHTRAASPVRVAPRVGVAPRPALTFTLPSSWSSQGTMSASGEMNFTVRSTDGRMLGKAVLSPFVPAAVNDVVALPARAKSLGGVSLVSLRRMVIDRMITEGGWVNNDMEREINGRRVFIVLAQKSSTAGQSQQSWIFYFTEVEGRISVLTTTAPLEYAASLAAESEQVMASLRGASAPAAAVAATAPR